VDRPTRIVSTSKKHGPGIIILGMLHPTHERTSRFDTQFTVLIPTIAFALGTWQVQRLTWKSDLIARYEDRLIREPLALPPQIDPTAIKDFDYRRVLATGTYRHDQEMLIGPRIHDGDDGYLVVTPLERKGGSTILICRGWISKKFKAQKDRPHGLPGGEVTVEGLLREPWKKNMFTPDNNPGKNEFYFPDVEQMARLTDSQPVWIEETMLPEFLESHRREEKGIPIGRAPEVNLRNNHAQYIFTWYVWMLVRKAAFNNILPFRYWPSRYLTKEYG
jgi:surfeit locus 1 family protein